METNTSTPKKINPQLIYAAIGVILAIAITLFQFFTDKGPAVVDVNSAVELDGVSYTVKSVDVTKDYNGHKTANSFIVLTVEAKNGTDKPIGISPSQFLIVDDQDKQYAGDPTRDLTFFGDKQYFSITDQINPGLSRTGRLSFEVPSNGKYRLGIRNNMFDFGGADYVYVNLTK